jgi:putative transposase
MKRTRFSEEQIVAILKQGEAGMKTGELCRQNGVSEATYYNWKAHSLTPYDALYVELAVRLNCPLATQDQIQKKVAQALAIRRCFAPNF